MSILSKLKPPKGSRRKANRVGRGPGSGNGKTCGKGMNGQLARFSGGRLYFEGGQMPLQRRVPKRGFRNILADRVANINVGELDVFDDGADVTIEALCERGLVKGRFDRVKVLGSGQLNKKLTVSAHAFSAGAADKIAGAGGQAVTLPAPQKKAETEGSES